MRFSERYSVEVQEEAYSGLQMIFESAPSAIVEDMCQRIRRLGAEYTDRPKSAGSSEVQIIPSGSLSGFTPAQKASLSSTKSTSLAAVRGRRKRNPGHNP
jgi:hypothetical protein